MGNAPTTGDSGRRDTSRDGLCNRLEYCLTSKFRPFWHVVNCIRPLSWFFNWFLVNRLVRKAPARPLQRSTFSYYTSWQSLTDRRYFGRYLAPRKADPHIKTVDEVAELFKADPESPTLSERSTLRFPAFAQWFTDGWLLTSRDHTDQTTSPHQIDLNPLYGLKPCVTKALEVGRLPFEGSGRPSPHAHRREV